MSSEPFDRDGVQGELHRGDGADAIVLTHGAGSNRDAPLLVALADGLAAAGISVLRVNLAYRDLRPHGPPFPATAHLDRQRLEASVAAVRTVVTGRVFLGGHSYGGRQSTMIAAERPELTEALLLLSYPLHPPRRPTQLRTAHFPALRTPALFAHGSRDPFGTPQELEEAIRQIPATTRLTALEGAGHELAGKRVGSLAAAVTRIVGEFTAFVRPDRDILSIS